MTIPTGGDCLPLRWDKWSLRGSRAITGKQISRSNGMDEIEDIREKWEYESKYYVGLHQMDKRSSRALVYIKINLFICRKIRKLQWMLCGWSVKSGFLHMCIRQTSFTFNLLLILLQNVSNPATQPLYQELDVHSRSSFITTFSLFSI